MSGEYRTIEYLLYAHDCRKEGRVPLPWERWRDFMRALR
jgi:hypothetical protein